MVYPLVPINITLPTVAVWAQSTKINTHWVPSGITMNWYVLISDNTKSATDLNFHGAADKPVRKNNIL